MSLILQFALAPLACMIAVGPSLAFGAGSVDESICDVRTLGGGLAPMDYRQRNIPEVQQGVDTVNKFHYFPAATKLEDGVYTSEVMADLAFTLNHWPNHQPALEALLKYVGLGGKPYEFPSPDCLLYRARYFAPDDVDVMLDSAFYYQRAGDLIRAETYYKRTLAQTPTHLWLTTTSGCCTSSVLSSPRPSSTRERLMPKGSLYRDSRKNWSARDTGKTPRRCRNDA